MKPYKRLYGEHCGIKIPSGFEIHHIDLDHGNNAINNLVMLPRELHLKYHTLLNETMWPSNKKLCLERVFSARITGNRACGEKRYLDAAEDLIKTIAECNKWMDYKMFLEGRLPNIHNIMLEDLQ